MNDRKWAIFGLFMACVYVVVLTLMALSIQWNDVIIIAFSIGYGITAYLFIACTRELRKKNETRK